MPRPALGVASFVQPCERQSSWNDKVEELTRTQKRRRRLQLLAAHRAVAEDRAGRGIDTSPPLVEGLESRLILMETLVCQIHWHIIGQWILQPADLEQSYLNPRTPEFVSKHIPTLPEDVHTFEPFGPNLEGELQSDAVTILPNLECVPTGLGNLNDTVHEELRPPGVIDVPAHVHPERSLHAQSMDGLRRELANACRADVLPHPAGAGASECRIVANLVIPVRNEQRKVGVAEVLPLTLATAEVAAHCEIQRDGVEDDEEDEDDPHSEEHSQSTCRQTEADCTPRTWETSETLIWFEVTARLANQAAEVAWESGEDPSSCLEKRMAVVQRRWGEARPNIPEYMRDGIWNMLCEQPEFWTRILNDFVQKS